MGRLHRLVLHGGQSWADYMVECCMADRSLSEDCFQVVGKHALIGACLNPCPLDQSVTIYECETGEIPNLDAIPEVGSFAVRHLAKIKKSDFKLSPKNEAGVFLGFATLKGTYGSVLMVGEGKYVVAREHVAYVQDHFLLQADKSWFGCTSCSADTMIMTYCRTMEGVIWILWRRRKRRLILCFQFRKPLRALRTTVTAWTQMRR